MEHLQNYCRDDSKITELLNIEDPKIISFLLESAENALQKYKTQKNKKYVKRSLDIIDTFSDIKISYKKSFCDNLKGLSWTGNSCYMDSVLFALFAIPNDINTNFLANYDQNTRNSRIQAEIINIMKYITTPNNSDYNCSNIRKIIRDEYHVKYDERFYTNKMQDAGEFLLFLVDKLENTNLLFKRDAVYGFNKKNNVEPISIQKKYDSIVWNVTPYNLQHLDINKVYNIRTLMTLESEDLNIHNWKYTNKLDVSEIIDSPYIIFNVMRKKMENNREIYLKHKIIPTKTLMINNDRKLYLHSIVVLVSNHYITYFRCNDWYVYNDMSSGRKISYVGSYADMLLQNTSPIKNGLLYFYTSKN